MNEFACAADHSAYLKPDIPHPQSLESGINLFEAMAGSGSLLWYFLGSARKYKPSIINILTHCHSSARQRGKMK